MTEHYCQEHQCKFYKNEKNGSIWYSHKLKDGSGYCNEPKEEAESTPTSKPTPAPHLVASPPPSATPSIVEKNLNSQGKSFALSYAKDLCVAGKIERSEIISWAKAFEGFLNDLLIIKDDDVFKEALKHCSIKGKEVKSKLIEEAKRLSEDT